MDDSPNSALQLRPRRGWRLAAVTLGILATPFVVVAMGLAEEHFLRTHYVYRACRAIGIADQMEQLSAVVRRVVE